MTEVTEALTHRYGVDADASATVSATEVADLLRCMPVTGDEGLIESIKSVQPDWVLDNLTYAIVQSVDDCATLIFRITQMAPEVDEQFRKVIPIIAAHIIDSPDLPIQKQPDLLLIMDSLNLGMVGWTDGLGAGSNKLRSVFEAAIETICSDGDLSALGNEITTFMEKEANKIQKLEQRLAASETGLVRSKQAKVLAANLINKKANGKCVTESLVEFLKGPWYDSLQFLVNEKGIQSEEWQRAGALTDTLIWTYQPIDMEQENAEQEKQKLYRLIEHLPTEVSGLMVALEHNTDATEAALETLETDHVSLVSGMDLNYVEFEAIPSEATLSSSKVSRVLLRKVNDLEPGQWFGHEDGSLIKLVLKLDDVQQLLFTNRNGMKVMQKSFDEFAYDLSTHVVRTINPNAAFSSTFKTYYQGLIDELKRHKQVIAERKAEVDRLDEDRKRAQQKAQKEAKQLALAKEEAERSRQEALKASRLESASAEVAKQENAGTVEEFRTVVASLATGAIVFLPDAMGEKQECKLAVRISAANKMIFVDRNGMKAGDYQDEQLVALLVAGEAELGDLGVEFEDTLAAVVSKLRSDREKSYDDLTGT